MTTYIIMDKEQEHLYGVKTNNRTRTTIAMVKTDIYKEYADEGLNAVLLADIYKAMNTYLDSIKR